MAAINIDWNAIRPINGTCQEGFEELCCQLANLDRPKDTSFIRKGKPDAGVECYSVFPDGREWGWQAKYFHTLGDSQWGQLDESVQTMLGKHPHLVRYYVCIPLDLSDARTEGRRSSRDRWNDRVFKWSGWACDRGKDVEFVYWGSHELIELLSRPQNSGRLWFWFDRRHFDETWFAARMDEAIKAAGPRYTPELHVELPIAAKFEAFGRTEHFIDTLRARARPLRKKTETLKTDISRKSKGDDSGDSEPVDEDLLKEAGTLVKLVDHVINGLGQLHSDPIGSLGLQQLAEKIREVAVASKVLEQMLREREKQAGGQLHKTSSEGTHGSYRPNNFRDQRYRLYELEGELRNLRANLLDADTLAQSSLLLLTGEAGIGKTHLLCDVARQRVCNGRPTVLLMGQRFLSNESPWTQALQHLDLLKMSVEEFVGALEAAAQAAGCRAVVLIDALNEGAGRRIWPEHLAAFLTYLNRSPWISVGLAVRSSYEQLVIPEEVQRHAVKIEHHGFAELEYDAARTYFDHYKLEYPSTPLLIPEFSNPLFLKVLCRGLSESGQDRLPRGFHGISRTFDLFLAAVNDRLAADLGFNESRQLVRRAVELITGKFVERGRDWLAFEEAEDFVNGLLPGREFGRSLFHGLVSEGVLIEERLWREGETSEEVVQIAYERLSDHLVAKKLIDLYVDPKCPEAAFADNGPLAYLGGSEKHASPGLIEALCVQVPERIGKELCQLAPKLKHRSIFPHAFRQSLIWRSPTAFSDATRKILNETTRIDHNMTESIDTMLTMATIPDHPFNAEFLHKRLTRDSMPGRDAWWSIGLHRLWGTRKAVDRLVEWAWSITPGNDLDDTTVDLTATALAWMLTTSNRFLRDRATKALVSLLTGRLPAIVKLLERVAAIDDMYVAERLYAVAYGCAMRSYDTKEVGQLAQATYNRLFKNGSPPPHILLRDYARGVVERALYLGSPLDIDPDRIRPPYQSDWPHIPTEEEIEPLKPNWGRGARDEWARNRIGSSILSDDFARYVIGTNSGVTSWLSLSRGEPAWKSPDEQLGILVGTFNSDEMAAWKVFDSADRALEKIVSFNIRIILKNFDEETATDGNRNDTNPELDKRILELEQERENALTRLLDTLTGDRGEQFRSILAATKDTNARLPPSFDLRLIQRYVLWRVFDFGWTTKRFEHFDADDIGYAGREASKGERIGKKYQWIAYHEILALVADHFQYRNWHDSDDEATYIGPWQDSFRDIDPSCTLRRKRSGTTWDGYRSAWWNSSSCGFSGDGDDQEWVRRTNDLLSVEQTLIAVRPQDGAKWTNLDGYLNWKQPVPVDVDPEDVDRREVWYMWKAYLVPADKTEAFMSWAEGVDFWNHWMPQPLESYKLFLGEHLWSPAAKYFERPYHGGPGWTEPGRGCPTRVCVATSRYLAESSGFDCSIDEGYTLYLPCAELVRILGVKWSGSAGDFVDDKWVVVAFDPTADSDGPSGFLVQQERLLESLHREGLSLCWVVIGEKRVLHGKLEPRAFCSLRMSGAYTLGTDGISGFLKCMFESAASRKDGSPLPKVVILRSANWRSRGQT